MVEIKVIYQAELEARRKQSIEQARSAVLGIVNRLGTDLSVSRKLMVGTVTGDDSFLDYMFWYITPIKESWLSRHGFGKSRYLRSKKCMITIFPENTKKEILGVIKRRYFSNDADFEKAKEIITEELNKLAQQLGKSKVTIRIE